MQGNSALDIAHFITGNDIRIPENSSSFDDNLVGILYKSIVPTRSSAT